MRYPILHDQIILKTILSKLEQDNGLVGVILQIKFMQT